MLPPLARVTLPGLDAPVSILGVGCWGLGGPAPTKEIPRSGDLPDPDAAIEGLRRAHDLGVTLFDTTDAYGLGHTERLLGTFLRSVNRDTIVVHGRVGSFAGTTRHCHEPAQMRRQLDTTLSNLTIDDLDIYFIDSLDFGNNAEHLLGAIDTLRRMRNSGLIRKIGMRAPHTFALEWAHSAHPQAKATRRWLNLANTIEPDVITVRYDLLSPLYLPEETDIFAFARDRGIGVLIEPALAQALIFGNPDTASISFNTNDHSASDPVFTENEPRATSARLAPLRASFGLKPGGLARVALRYALRHAPDAAILVGLRDADEIATTITSLGGPLTDDEISEVRQLLHPTTP